MQLVTWPLLGLGLAASAVVMVALWVRQRRSGNAGTVDVGWAACLAGMAVLFGALGDGSPMRRVLAAVLGGAWALRLALHLAARVAGQEEDGRYRALREKWGESAQPKLLAFFLAQAVAAAVFAIPFLVVASDPRATLGPLPLLGVATWLVAVVGEGIADAQLAAFKKSPLAAGRTCRIGLWSWSRHPNYFFEWIHWWAYVLIAAGGPAWWLTLLGPVLMLWLLFKVTGIPYTEEQALKSRGDDYRRYQQTTSAFFPWPPRSAAP